ncbi:MAG: Amidohydrolase 3 [Dehalococcoidales bacterium]|nr:Amidohydrolase 3 [Dehalococcoidales bacterium]
MPVADIILKNANVITVDPGQPAASLVAIKGDRIGLVGDSQELESLQGAATRVIDCHGKTLLPGFNDAHCHFFSFVRKLLSLDLSPLSVRSIDDIKTAIRQKAQNTPHGRWIAGTGYNDFYLAEKRHPTRWDIDAVAPHHPVILSHRSLHACVLNRRALSLAGITRETPEPPGGLIDRDLNGEPTGLLFEMLGYIRERVLPPLSEAELTEGITLANQHHLSQGITSLQEATVVNSLSQWQKFRRFIDSGHLKTRLYMMPGMDALSQFQEAGLTFGDGDSWLRLGGVKVILSEATGRLYPPQAKLNQQVLNAHQAGFQLAIHAVQPSTLEAAIIALEYAQSQLPRPGRRHRIEHCSVCPPHLLERLQKLKVVIATQPPFLYYSGERYLVMLATDELPWLYRIRSWLDAGLVVAASSDSPVVPDNPFVGIYAAVTRQAASGQTLLPDERITARQALAMYTINGAYASFEEDIKGSISPGKLADMVLVSDDPTMIPPEQIKDIKVEMTILGGEVVWQA